MSFLDTVLSDKPAPARVEKAATDDKPSTIVDHTEGSDADDGFENGSDSAATSAASTEAGKPAADAKADDSKTGKVDEKSGKEQGRDDQGRYQKTVPQEALHAERQRRQNVEAELAKLRGDGAKPPPSVLEDEDGAFNARIAIATAPLQAKLFKISVKAARSVAGREDYEEVVEAFNQAADKDPNLTRAFMDSEDPGEFAYTVGKQIRELADVGGDVVKYGEKKRAEGAAEVESLKDQIKALQSEIETLKNSNQKREKVPQSLNSEQSAAGKDTSFSGPRPLKQIFN